MKATKRRKLEKAEWRVGSVEEFLGLTPEDAALVEMRLKLERGSSGALVARDRRFPG